MKEWIQNLGMEMVATLIGGDLANKTTDAVEKYNASLPQNRTSSYESVPQKISENISENTASFEEGLNK